MKTSEQLDEIIAKPNLEINEQIWLRPIRNYALEYKVYEVYFKNDLNFEIQINMDDFYYIENGKEKKTKQNKWYYIGPNDYIKEFACIYKAINFGLTQQKKQLEQELKTVNAYIKLIDKK